MSDIGGNPPCVVPNRDLVTIGDNIELITQFLSDLVLRPRRDLMKWASVTKQTPNINIGYPAQHLASLVTGVEGARTAARGHDLCDHSEVKSCSRVDQLDTCTNCRAAVARMETLCPSCGSSDIRRNNDSKWLLAVKSQRELAVLVEEVPRVVFILADYPNFGLGDWETIQFQVFEIWPQDPRQHNFRKLMTSYFQNIFLPHTEENPQKTPAPKNIWPYSFQFYMCNPVRIFHCIVRDALHNFAIDVAEYIDPRQDREAVPPIRMPFSTLNARERDLMRVNLGASAYEDLTDRGLDSKQRLLMPLRDAARSSSQSRRYQRGQR